MSGTKYLFDTNTLINFFKGNPALQPFINVPLCISIVSVIEFLSFPRIENEHKILLDIFLKKADVIDLTLNNTALIDRVIIIRSTYRLKLPDAIIAATALHTDSILISNDGDFKKLYPLKIITY